MLRKGIEGEEGMGWIYACFKSEKSIEMDQQRKQKLIVIQESGGGVIGEVVRYDSKASRKVHWVY